MNVTSVEMHPANSSLFEVLSFRDPTHQNPYTVRAIIGLDADEIIARYYGGSGGLKFYNMSLEKRDIIIRIQLNPRFEEGETYSGLREKLYRMISSSRTGLLQLRFKDKDVCVAYISGFVTKFESPHSTKTPELQITINCKDPMLMGFEPVELNVSSFNASIFSINDEESSAHHGFKMVIGVIDNISGFKIFDPTTPGWSFEVRPPTGFFANDIFHMSSEHNNRHTYVLRGGNKLHVADGIFPGSIWPIIFPGENFFSLENESNFNWISASYYNTYWGV